MNESLDPGRQTPRELVSEVADLAVGAGLLTPAQPDRDMGYVTVRPDLVVRGGPGR